MLLAKEDKVWVLDLDPNDVHPWWDLWVMGKKPLCELEWDPREWKWLPNQNLGRMVGRFHFLNIPFDWEGRLYDVGYPIGYNNYNMVNL